MIMFVLDWTAYPFICLSVAVPMAFFYVIERRRESKEYAAYDGPCMAHVGNGSDGVDLWCWQRSGHSGEHDDYTRDREWFGDLVSKAPLIHHDPELTESHWTPGTDEV